MIMFMAFTAESYATGPRSLLDGFQLYIPGGGQTSMTWSQQHEYDEVKLSRLGATMAAGMMGTSVGIGGSGGGSVTGGAFRKIINPMVEVLYRGTDLRSFDFSFMFAPESREDALMLYGNGGPGGNGILNRFRHHAAPRNQGAYFDSPSEWEIMFMYRSKNGAWTVNSKIPKIAKGILTRVDVDYGPDSEFSTFEDGRPTSARLTMNFREMEIVDKNRIEAGL